MRKDTIPTEWCIDADSLIYKSCFNTMCDATELPEDTEGVYVIGVEQGSSLGEEGPIQVIQQEYITARHEQDALIKYTEKTGDNSYLKIVSFEPSGEEIALETKEDESLQEGQRAFVYKVNEIAKRVIARYPDINPIPTIVITTKDDSEHCIKHAPNYRYLTMANVEDPAVKGYKSNRPPTPDGILELYDWVFTQPDTICKEGCEADDVVVRMGKDGWLVCALDKDVLGSLEEAYNYGRKEWSIKTPLEIRQFPFLQTIMGDTSDGLRGVYRVGLKGAEKALKGKETELEMWTAVVTQYFKKGQTLEEAVATMLCVRMDMWTEETGIVYWTPPKRKG